MNKSNKYSKPDVKGKKKGFNNNYVDEDMVSQKEVKRNQDHKKYKNYGNILRAKNVSALMEYEED